MPSKFDPQKHHRRSIRLKAYDYTQPGGYFITIVTYQRDSLFGQMVKEDMQLSDLGKIADECWRLIPEHFSNVELGAYVVMPNHLHGIIMIHADAPLSSRKGTIYRALPNNFKNPLSVRSPPLFAHIRRRLRAVPDVNLMSPMSGSAIITNTLLEMKRIYRTKPII